MAAGERVRDVAAAIPRAWWTSSSTRQLPVPALGGAKDYAPLNNIGGADQVHSNGTYLVDLFSWMHYYGIDITDISPVRVMWDRGEDEPGLHCDPQDVKVVEFNPNACLGLFTNSSQDKYVTISHCPSNQAQGTQAMAFDFYWLRAGPCN